MAAGANTSVSLTATGQSAAIPVSKHGSGKNPCGFVLDFTTVTAVGTASVEFTFDSYEAIAGGTALWFALSNFSGKTATTVDTSIMPMTAVRLNVTAYTSGTITLRINQGV